MQVNPEQKQTDQSAHELKHASLGGFSNWIEKHLGISVAGLALLCLAGCGKNPNEDNAKKAAELYPRIEQQLRENLPKIIEEAIRNKQLDNSEQYIKQAVEKVIVDQQMRQALEERAQCLLLEFLSGADAQASAKDNPDSLLGGASTKRERWEQLSQSLQAMIDAAVFIEDAGCSGVIIAKRSLNGTEEMYILTANHCDCEVEGELHVIKFSHSNERYLATVFAHNEKDDLALLRVEVPLDSSIAKRIPAQIVPERFVSQLTPFLPVAAVSCPSLQEEPFPTVGVLGNPDANTITGQRLQLQSAPVSYGSSGGPVYELITHRLIGIVSSMQAIITSDGIPTSISSMSYSPKLEKIHSFLASNGFEVRNDGSVHPH